MTATAIRNDRLAPQAAIVFQLAGQAYGLPLHAVREILHVATLSQPPGLPPVLAGFLNLGGVAIPVVKLARLLGLPEQQPGLYTPLILVQSGQQPLALLVDAVQSIAAIDASDLALVHDNLCFNDCAVGLATCGDMTIVLLSEDRLLREEEQCRLDQLAAIEQARLAGLEAARS